MYNSNIAAQINKIVETFLPLQKSSAALHDFWPTHAHFFTHKALIVKLQLQTIKKQKKRLPIKD